MKKSACREMGYGRDEKICVRENSEMDGRGNEGGLRRIMGSNMIFLAWKHLEDIWTIYGLDICRSPTSAKW